MPTSDSLFGALHAGFSVSDVQNARNMENNALFLQEKKVMCCAALCGWYKSGDVRLYVADSGGSWMD